MEISKLQTPAVILDLDKAERNVRKYCDEAAKYGKQIWPMMKTHKSIELAKLQMSAGCTGALCGTLDEAELFADAGIENIMYAYPVATDVSARRVAALAEKCSLIIRLDSEEAAKAVQAEAEKKGVRIDYTVIVDAGLHRFGIQAGDTADFVKKLEKYPNLVFRGISTHPGHVYEAQTPEEVGAYAEDEIRIAAAAAKALDDAGIAFDIVSSGSTPTFSRTVCDGTINIHHPGNYIFNDSIQMSLGTVGEEDCALYVLASVISHPAEGLYICDAGAKCLGLDRGAHGNSSVKGYGTVIGHPELTVSGLSEEVGKIHADGPTDLKIGGRIKIIPNHSCSTANLTSYYLGVRGDETDHAVKVDARSNSGLKNLIQ